MSKGNDAIASVCQFILTVSAGYLIQRDLIIVNSVLQNALVNIGDVIAPFP